MARAVQIAGDFNDWKAEAQSLDYIGYGEWSVRLDLESSDFEYRFVVDGRFTTIITRDRQPAVLLAPAIHC